MTTAYVTERAAQLVAEGWVRDVVRLPGGTVRARVGGYVVECSPKGRMSCDCPRGHYQGGCSHALALRMTLE